MIANRRDIGTDTAGYCIQLGAFVQITDAVAARPIGARKGQARLRAPLEIAAAPAGDFPGIVNAPGILVGLDLVAIQITGVPVELCLSALPLCLPAEPEIYSLLFLVCGIHPLHREVIDLATKRIAGEMAGSAQGVR